MSNLELKKMREKFGLTQEDLAKKLQTTRKTINSYENKGNIPAPKSLLLKSFFEKLEQELLENEEETEAIEIISEEEDDRPLAIYTDNPNEGLPLIPLNAMAGIAQGEVSVLELECERYVIPVFKAADFLISVSGSSMIPKYNSGDIVACKKLSLNDIFFQWNKVYVLDTDQGALIKRVHKGSKEGYITLISDNESYPPFEIKISQIYAIALVIGVVRME